MSKEKNLYSSIKKIILHAFPFYLGCLENKVQIYLFIYFIYLFFCLFAFSRAAPTAYGDSQARDLIRARATAMWDPSRICNLHHSSWQRQILNPLSEARDRTRNLMVPSWIHFHCAMMGTPRFVFVFPFWKVLCLY